MLLRTIFDERLSVAIVLLEKKQTYVRQTFGVIGDRRVFTVHINFMIIVTFGFLFCH